NLWIDGMPHQGTRKRYMRFKAEILTCFRCVLELIDRPCRSIFWLAAQRLGSKAIEQVVVGRVNRNQLSLEVGGKFRYLHAARFNEAFPLITIVLALGSLVEIDTTFVPRGNLHADIAQGCSPFADRPDIIERWLVPHELGKEYRRPLNVFHNLTLASFLFQLCPFPGGICRLDDSLDKVHPTYAVFNVGKVIAR